MFTLTQLAGILAALAGLYLLSGLAWALLIGGLALAGISVLGEWQAGRPRPGRGDGG